MLPASRGDGMCACEGCEKPKARKHPLCHGHAKRYQRNGLIGGPLRNPITDPCAAVGCDRMAEAKGYCRRCRLREQRGWDLTESPAVPPPRKKTPKYYEGVECAIRDCRKQAESRGFCMGHYQSVIGRGAIVEDGKVIPRRELKRRQEYADAAEAIRAIFMRNAHENLMIVHSYKTCGMCGEAKPPSEFYYGSKGPGRKKAYGSFCKACAKTRVAKRLAGREGREYVPRPVSWGEGRICKLCGEHIYNGSSDRVCPDCRVRKKRVSKFGAWGKVIAKGCGKTRAPARRYGEWTERIGSALSSLRIRDRDKVDRKVRQPPTMWKQAIAQAKGKLKQDDRYGIWTRKIRNTVHNWSIKSRAKAERRRTIRLAESTGV